MMEVNPISPDEAAKSMTSGKDVPSFVIKVINRMLAERYSGAGAVMLMQKEVIESILCEWPDEYLSGEVSTERGARRSALFSRGMLDFEPMFEKKGWVVKYDKPAYWENYEPSWKFSSRE
jgi:hypothetical protein